MFREYFSLHIVFNYCAIMNQVTAMDVQNIQTNKRISLIKGGVLSVSRKANYSSGVQRKQFFLQQR